MIQIIYIAGCNFSGSTLLSLILGTHSKICSVGEFGRLSSYLNANRVWEPTSENPDRSCTCGAPSLIECEFWSNVFNVSSIPLSCIFHSDKYNQSSLTEFEVSLLESAVKVSNSCFIVDSSKLPNQMQRLLNTPQVRLHVIHLVKDVREYSGSLQKRNGNPARAYLGWLRWNFLCGIIGRRADSYLRITYKDLATKPVDTLTIILNQIGLPYEEEMLEYWKIPHHDIGGNRMRRDLCPIKYEPHRGKSYIDHILYFGLFWIANQIFHRSSSAHASVLQR